MNTLFHAVLLSILIVSTSAGPQPEECPVQWYDAMVVSITDRVVPAAEYMNQIDPTFSFFTDVLRFSDEETEEATQSAITYLDTTFGLDFSSDPDDLGRRFYQNATFFPYRNPFPHIVTFSRWILNGNTRTLCFPNMPGGFQVSFSAPQLLRGTYGGTEGLPVAADGALFWGFYNMPVCPQSPVVFQFRSVQPDRFDPIDGFTVINCDIHNRILGNGTGQGIFKITPLPEQPGMIHVNLRTIFTLPERPLIP